jgi:hypothetical protein
MSDFAYVVHHMDDRSVENIPGINFFPYCLGVVKDKDDYKKLVFRYFDAMGIDYSPVTIQFDSREVGRQLWCDVTLAGQLYHFTVKKHFFIE